MASCACRTETCAGPSTRRGPKVRAARPVASNRAEERPSTSTVEWAAVWRERSAQSPPNGCPGPAFTMSRWRPTLISKASVPAWARVAAAPPGGAAPSMTTTRRLPERRTKPSGSRGFCWVVRRSSARAWSSRPGSPAPPPLNAAMPPSPRRSGRIAGTARTIAWRCGAIACWSASSSRRAVQISRMAISARSSGARDGVLPSASTSASASAAISARASEWPGCGRTIPVHTSPEIARSRGRPGSASVQARAR